MNLARMSHVRPLPTKSSTYFQTNCIKKMKRQMKNVPAKSCRYPFNIKMSSFFIILIGLFPFS